MMLSFAMMQFSLWQAVTQLLGLPRTMTMVLLVMVRCCAARSM